LILSLSAFGAAKTSRFFDDRTYKWITFISLSFYALAKGFSFFTGANHIETHIPLGTPGAILSSGFILPLNICVGMVVACTVYGFYTLFSKGKI
jgi:multicomponent Na+:H+ antiporter subunit B